MWLGEGRNMPNSFFFGLLAGPLNKVADAVHRWEYQSISSEAEAEELLYDHLRMEFPGIDIRRQFNYDRIRADLLVNDEVAIELKYNLVETTELQRLIGQLDTYHSWGKQMLVLVIGNIHDDYVTRLKQRLMRDWGDEDQARFINLPTSRAAP